MPALEMAQDTGKLIQWLKAEGENVAKGEPLMEIETDKVTVEIEAPASGVLANVSAAPGDDVPVGQVIALILAPGEPAPPRPVAPVAAGPAPRPSGVQAPPATAPALAAAVSATPVAARIAAEHGVDLALVRPAGGRIEKADVLGYLALTPHPRPLPPLRPSSVPPYTGGSAGEGGGVAQPGRGVRASPKARRLAGERGVDLATLAGSGPDGAVLAQDVLEWEGMPAPAPVEALALGNVWRVMAERMTQSWTSAPHFYLLREVNASRLVDWRARAQERVEEKLTYTDLLLKLTAAALREHPRVNAAWSGDTVVLNAEINIGLAVAIADGLIVPVLHAADGMSLNQIAARRKDLVARALEGKLRPDDVRAGTFTISNLGMYGVDAFDAVVNPPQAAILAVGRLAERVVVVNGQPAVRPTLMLTLSFDHRAVDGARGARFLDTLANLIEDPLRLVN